MMIDLKNTYIENDFGELRDAYVKDAAAQGYQIDDGTEPVEWLDGDFIFIKPHHDWCVTTGGSLGMIKPINKMKKITISDLTGIAEKGNTEWVDGLPPVGAECIVIPHNTRWGFNYVEEFTGKVIYYHNESFVFALKSSKAWLEPDGVITSRTDKVDFKRQDTPEQKKKNKFVLELESMLNDKEMGYCSGLAEAIYDAGYRKPE